MDGRISNLAQVASVRRYTLTEGSGRGLDVLDCDNGRLRFLLNVSRACDMMQLYHEGQNVSFVSKNGSGVRDLPFLRRFEGGMIYTCGLDSVGGREGYELHGTLHTTPAEIIRAECNEAGITVEAVVRDTSLFGKNLVLRRKITAALGAETVTVQDTLTNEGFCEQEYCLLYHVNVGYPMLDEGARVVADIEKCEPRTPRAAERQASAYEIGPSVAGDEETCYYLTLRRPEASIVNDRLGKTLTVSYSGDTLPHFLEWKSMASGDYALGLEPCTTQLDDRFAYKTLGANERRVFEVSITVKK